LLNFICLWNNLNSSGCGFYKVRRSNVAQLVSRDLACARKTTPTPFMYLFLFNEASPLRTYSYLQWRSSPAKPGRCWANCAPPYGTPNYSSIWYSLDSNQGP
jgi:hypothetical protein